MKKFISAAFVLAALAGCGVTPCEAVNTANDRFFAGKTECKSTSGSSSITLTRGNKCTDTSKCTESDLKAIDTYASCLSKAQVCSAGNEEKATSEGAACAFASLGSVSSDCQAAIK
jgi:hypothetical protein